MSMKTIYDIIKEMGAEQGVDVMWDTTRVISDAIEESMPEEAKERLYADLYGHLSGGHYNEEFSMKAVEDMYYTDDSGNRHYAPYWTEAVVHGWYEQYKRDIPQYNCWDFFVTLNMIASDNHNLLTKWFPNDTPEDRDKRFVALAVNWLKDEDWPDQDKIWHYLNA